MANQRRHAGYPHENGLEWKTQQKTCALNESVLCSPPTGCHAPHSLAKVQALCLGKNSCAAAATSQTFGGDPCDGVNKWAAVRVHCTQVGPPPGAGSFIKQLGF